MHAFGPILFVPNDHIMGNMRGKEKGRVWGYFLKSFVNTYLYQVIFEWSWSEVKGNEGASQNGILKEPDLCLGFNVLGDLIVEIVSTKILSKTYIRINYICISINNGVMKFNCSKPTFTQWLPWTTITSTFFGVRERIRVHIVTTSIHHYGFFPVCLREGHPQHSHLSYALGQLHRMTLNLYPFCPDFVRMR